MNEWKDRKVEFILPHSRIISARSSAP
jgi:hypothetical protein